MRFRQCVLPAVRKTVGANARGFSGGGLAQEEDVTNEMRLIGCKMVQDACKRKTHDPNFEGKWRLEPFFADSSQMALVSLIWH